MSASNKTPRLRRIIVHLYVNSGSTDPETFLACLVLKREVVLIFEISVTHIQQPAWHNI